MCTKEKIRCLIKKLLSVTLGLAVIFLSAFMSSCKENETDESGQNNTSTLSSTKPYYQKIGYTEIFISKSFEVSGKQVADFDDGTVFALKNSYISLKFVETDFELCNSISSLYIDFNNCRILTGINVNGIIYDALDFDLDNVLVTENLSITPIYDSFGIYGVTLWADLLGENQIDSAKVKLNDGDEELFFVAFDTNIISSDFSEDTIYYDTEYDFSYDDKNFYFTFDYCTDEVPLGVYLILGTESGDKYLLPIPECENSGYFYEINYLGSVYTFHVSLEESPISHFE